MQTVKAILALCGWFILTFVLSTFFVSGLTPPGGVSCFYFVVILLIPFGAFRAARTIERASVILCYGLVSGAILAWPVFIDGRTGLSIAYGHETVFGLCVRILAFAGAIAVASLVGYFLGQAFDWGIDGRDGKTQPAWPVVPLEPNGSNRGSEAEAPEDHSDNAGHPPTRTALEEQG